MERFQLQHLSHLNSFIEIQSSNKNLLFSKSNKHPFEQQKKKDFLGLLKLEFG